MIWLYAALFAVAAILTTRLFLASRPERIAAALRFGAPLIACVAGMVLTALGRPFIGFPLVGVAVASGLYMLARPRAPVRGRRRTTVRTAALEMELDL